MQLTEVRVMIKFLLLAVAVNALNSTASDEVTSLPHLKVPLCFKHFSGYVPVDNGAKHLHYWYFEATESPETKPLLLWLNGGPGCSSLAGMWVENGPFVLDKDLNISLNPYSWNKVANVLYLEQPAGVGFSYPAMKTNDQITANDTYNGLLGFLGVHTELKGRDFFIAGESYGGHYVPNTAKAIQEGGEINLKGFAVGNGYTDWQLDFNMNVPNGRWHALTSPEVFDAADTTCNGDFARCFWPRDDVTCPKDCDAAVQAATNDAMDGSIDIYDIYEDVCLSEKDQVREPTQATRLLEERHKQLMKHSLAYRASATKDRRRLAAAAAGLSAGEGTTGTSGTGTTISPIFDTCIDNYVSAYLNLPEVQAAIHVDSSTVPGGKWAQCGLTGMYDFNYESELPNYAKWTAENKLNILIYNGDADCEFNNVDNAGLRDVHAHIERETHRCFCLF
jgi:hypothetical protein